MLRIPAYLMLALALPGAAVAGDFVDTRLVFIAGDDDFMHDAGTTVPPSQLPDIGERAGYDTFFDQRDGRESGRESRTHLVLHKGIEGYWPSVQTDAALVLELNHSRMMSGDPRTLSDDGTYLRVRRTSDAGEFELLLMPFDSDRLRLGWLWDTTWGGNHVFPEATLVPALRMAWRAEWWDIMGGVKTARQQFVTRDLDARSGQMEAFYGVFGGVGVGSRTEGVRLEVQGAFFEKGRNPNGPVRGEPVDAGGVSARISYVDGLPFVEGDDTRLYSGDPVKPWNADRGAQGWRVAAEVDWVNHVLEDPELTGGTTREAGMAVAAYGSGRAGHTKVLGRAIYRDLTFLFFDHPGVVRRYQALPDDLDATGEFVLVLGLEHYLPSSRLTPGVTVGVQKPAALTNVVPNAGIHAPEVLTGRRTAVYRRANMFDDTGLMTGYFLPDGAEAKANYGGRFHLTWDLAEGFALVGEVTVIVDDNRVLLEQDILGVNSIRGFEDPLTVGAAIMARAEF